MATQIFVNLPVKDLDKTVAFYTKLGFSFNPQFTDENATCMIVSDESFVMFLVESYYKTFTTKDICDAKRSSEVIVCISADSREGVDEMINKAVEAGAVIPKDKQDLGFMYSHSFEDPDGHLWEVMNMDMTSFSGT